MKNNLFILTLIFCFFSQPFIFEAVFFNAFLSNIVKVILIIALIGRCKPFRFGKTESSIMLFLMVYFFIQMVINTVYIKQVFIVLPDIIFVFIILFLLSKNKTQSASFLNLEIKLSVFIAALIIISKLAFTYTPSLFSSREIGGYPTFFNYLLGLVNPGKDRPSWFFAEPSYSGFYLGLNFILLTQEKYPSLYKKIVHLIIIGAAIYSTASMGTYAYILLSLPFLLLNRTRVNKNFITLGVAVAIYAVLLISSSYDLFLIDQDLFDLESHGVGGRQDRMANAEAVMASGSFLNVLFGHGLECVTFLYKEGISDAYHKLYCEWGLLFTIAFFYFVWKLTRKNVAAFVFIAASYFSICIHMSPIIMIIYYLIYYQSVALEEENEKRIIIKQLKFRK